MNRYRDLGLGLEMKQPLWNTHVWAEQPCDVNNRITFIGRWTGLLIRNWYSFYLCKQTLIITIKPCGGLNITIYCEFKSKVHLAVTGHHTQSHKISVLLLFEAIFVFVWNQHVYSSAVFGVILGDVRLCIEQLQWYVSREHFQIAVSVIYFLNQEDT